MLRKWILWLLAMLAALALMGQPLPDPDSELLFQLNLEAVGEGSAVQTRQIGNYNWIYLEQNRQQTVAAQQLGNYNEIEIHLQGRHNQVLVDQQGNDNYYELNFSGRNSRLRAGQYGDDNTIIQNLRQANFLDISIYQFGNDNRVEHTEQGAGPMSIPLIIQQTGGMQLKITDLSTYNGGL